ncbi:hypothetical protein Taro_021249, partial [Colocasia esculenta]|nr:hypothetical protein [Colocasia esculenta]
IGQSGSELALSDPADSGLNRLIVADSGRNQSDLDRNQPCPVQRPDSILLSMICLYKRKIYELAKKHSEDLDSITEVIDILCYQ